MSLELSGIAISSAFLAGMISFLSPCVLPLVPGYVSYVAGQSLEDMRAERRSLRARLDALILASFFVAGFSLIFIALGASATALGQALQSWRGAANLVAGSIVTLFGLHMLGLLPLARLQREWRFGAGIKGGRPVGALALGGAFAFGWTPCIGPILGAILTLGASTLGVASGVQLLAIYSAGLAVPFLLVALFTDAFMARLAPFRRLGRIAHLAAGGLLVAVGIAMATGWLASIGTWLLLRFPGFQEILL
ncbi:MAG: cytochrome c biogenesis protein CcdA [Rhodospirillales bacterium]|nr:cytochrome c biogenesis protein CcdA [Rhodospirillales bacterium]